ncbi:hypothetical protein [Undibacterium sp. RuTC16W]|uniref:hypothetical protein n=1 Tax=Undibacterium sp. RuTC16W TaxID=3413048 RepID=UPI003BF31582
MSEFELTIYKLLLKEIEQSDFERWVYSEKKLSEILTSDDYLELISLNYQTSSSLYDAGKILRKHIGIGKCYEWHLKNVLQRIINRTADVHKYIEECYDLYCDGYYFLDNLGLGYGLAVIVPREKYKGETWLELTTQDQQELINEFYPGIAEEAKKVISWLNSGKIVLTDHSGEYQGIEYQDNRTAIEKEPTGYKCKKREVLTKSWWKFW